MIQKISSQIPKYEILEEIHATSYPAYINTEIKSGYNISIEVKYKNVEPFESGTYRRIFSTDAEWNDKRTLAVNYNDSKLEVKFIGEIAAISSSGILYDTTSEHTVYLSSEYFKYDGKTYMTRTKSVRTSIYDILIAQSFYKSSLDQGYYNYYYVKIWDNDTLVRDYVPVKRLSDNKYGLYDYVNDTFYSSAGTAEFTGTSKAEPEYIYDNQEQTLYVNDIIINNTHINRIYNNGEIYWGNAAAPPAPAWHGIRGTANVTSRTLSNAIIFNGTNHNVEVDENGNWEIEENNPIYTTGNSLCNSNNITSIDFRNTIWATISQTNGDTFGNLFFSGNVSNLHDIYFDFTGQNTNDMCLDSGIFSALSNCRIHGFGTFNWHGEINVSNTTSKHTFSLREFNRNGIIGTLDLRGLDTTSITDQDVSSIQRTALSFDWTYGYWYLFPNMARFDTFIIGALEIQTNYFTAWGGPSNSCTTLYCTSQTPPSLSRTGAHGLTCYNWLNNLSQLQHIYVPTGCLAAYQNDPDWSAKANIMSELDAPDPLTI